VLKSVRRVDDDVLSVLEIVIGEEPMTVNPVHDVEPEQDTDVVAIVFRRPVEPTYPRPCESEVNLSGPENVDEAVEKNPFSSPRVVVVET
jgi:hypothetical protein